MAESARPTSPPRVPAQQPPPLAHPRRWWALCVLGLAQLMILLDSTIVSVAMPSLQTELGMADGDRPWVVTSYTVAFGGLLLFAGRIADHAGRTRVFVSGLVGFAVASAAAGAAPTAQALFAARAVQGAFAALLAASALALVATSFPDPAERRRAIAVFGALGGAGASLGVVLGGVLTQGFGWRWCLLVNVPIALVALLGAAWMPRDRSPRVYGRVDVSGAVLGCGGLTALVYGCSRAEADGWAAPSVLGALLGGAALLVAFGVRQTRAAVPLLPPKLVRDRGRVAALLAGGALMMSQLSVSLFLTYYLQTVLGWSAMAAGLGFLPISIVTTATATQLGTRLLPRFGPRVMMTAGLCISAGGLCQLTLLGPESAYLTSVLPALATFSVGLGGSFLAIMNAATTGVPAQDAGIASAVVNSVQQVGGSIGSAVFNTVAASAAAAFHGGMRAATLHGFTVAVRYPMGVLLLAAAATATLGRSRRRAPDAVRADERMGP
ncbi:MFS transporter [Streptomyces sp. CB02959]|uniref:MFS transporter n=1 Tax=Streptomyces sp. CB02959 TaxID=2020330 RepID=UPI002153009C|nr:MFS transporter [Streptomyces sp. CB02959]